MSRTPTDLSTDTAELELTAPTEGGAGETILTSGEDRPPADATLRVALAVGASTVAAAVMVGGIFVGVAGPRIWASIAGVLGVVAATRIRLLKNPWLMNVAILLTVVAIGVILTLPAGSLSDVVNPGPFIRDAITSADVQRPPVEFSLGWRTLLGWLMGVVGLGAAWVALELKRPALGVLIPLPVVAFAAISVADDAKLASGILALILFAIGLAMLSGVEGGEADSTRSLAFELRRAARAAPLLAGITVALILLARANVLFPAPVYDPSQSAQKPKAIPLSEVPDRVLFTVDSSVTGPWRMGSLDVYDGNDWRLPPFADNRINEVPETGIVDSELRPGVRATFVTEGLTGAVLPGLPNLVGLVAEGPILAHDRRTGVIRLANGSIGAGLEYTVTAARIPTVEELNKITAEPPEEIEGVPVQRFLDIPPPPRDVLDAIQSAPQTSRWATFDAVRNELLDTVVASGAGAPRAVPPERVEEMLTGNREGTPFEIVAAQAMLARWVGIPSRIGYGFDGGDQASEGEGVEVRPRHGATFVEVYFPGHKWLPIIGTPRQAATSLGNTPSQRPQEIGASDDVAVQLFVPFETDPRNYLFNQVRAIASVVLPVIALLALLYFTYPALFKYLRKRRRRAAARNGGPPARIALAYAEWRDLCTDFGYRHASDTPLMFLQRVVPDEEHMELAWLVTRTMWGDLRSEFTEDEAVIAEELSRSLRRRLSQAHTWTLRFIAVFSRLSVRSSYAPHFDVLDPRDGRSREVARVG
jgi:hypothetical protein